VLEMGRHVPFRLTFFSPLADDRHHRRKFVVSIHFEWTLTNTSPWVLYWGGMWIGPRLGSEHGLRRPSPTMELGALPKKF